MKSWIILGLLSGVAHAGTSTAKCRRFVTLMLQAAQEETDPAKMNAEERSHWQEMMRQCADLPVAVVDCYLSAKTEKDTKRCEGMSKH